MMNTSIDGSAAMEHDATMAPSNGYGNDNWANISPYSQSPYDNSPMNEYASFGQFMPCGLPSESVRMLPPHPGIQPPPSQPEQQPHHMPHHQLIQPAPPSMGHHQLPMLNTTWPSQLTNPTPTSSAGSYSAPPLSITPASSGPPPTPLAPSSAALPPISSAKVMRPSQAADIPKQPSQPEKTPRKTLSAEQKRAMCQYHDENPGTRQADIGAKFGVERSTVSKVLRHRDQYLKRDQDAAEFAYKRAKIGKHPDFDRTLSNYIRRQQQRGFDVKDEEIMEQAKLFAHASGNQEGLLSTLTSSWLQKFKQKHGLGSGRLLRRASEANIPDSARMSTAHPTLTKITTPGETSPTSPMQPLSPLSGSRSDEDLHKETLDFEFTYRAHGSQSNTSLASDIRDNGASSFSPDTISPAASFNFSPDPNAGAFVVDQPMHIHGGEAPNLHHRGKRSNTFPSIDVNFVNQESSAVDPITTPVTPRHPPVTSASSSAVQSPTAELRVAPFTTKAILASPPPLRRKTSSSNITGRPSGPPITTTAAPGTPADSSPASPTQEEARQAANTLLSYIQRMSQIGQFDQGEYHAVVQLTKKLQLHQHQSSRPSIGGLSRIPEGDHEMPVPTETTMEVR